MSEPIKSQVRTSEEVELVRTVMDLFIDLLLASGARIETVRAAAEETLSRSNDRRNLIVTSHLGPVLRDCMEVMCAWRRHPEFVDQMGDPLPLPQGQEGASFGALCKMARCKSGATTVLGALVEFGAVEIDKDAKVVSLTPTFLAGKSGAGRLAVDGVVHQLAGFLQVIHRNVCSVSSSGGSRFERACSVQVAAELEPVFAQLVRTRGQEFIDSIDEWLERNSKYPSPSGRYEEMGAGAYFINFRNSPARSIS